jgi:hypothetical protein
MQTVEKALIECPICNRKMKRITVTHLRKHNMTMAEFREKYGSIVATTPSQMIDLGDPNALRYLSAQIVKKIVSGDQLDDVARQAIQSLLHDHEPDLLVSLQLNAARMINSLNFLYTQLEKIQEAMLDDRRVAGMNHAELARTYALVEKSIQNILSHLKSLSIDRSKKTSGIFEQTNIMNVYQNDPDAPPSPQSPAGREKVRALFKGLVQAAEDGRLTAIVPVEEKMIDAPMISQESADGDQAEASNQEREGSSPSTDGDFS